MPETDATAESLAAELKTRGVPLEIVLQVAQIMLEDDPDGMAKLMAQALQMGVPAHMIGG